MRMMVERKGTKRCIGVDSRAAAMHCPAKASGSFLCIVGWAEFSALSLCAEPRVVRFTTSFCCSASTWIFELRC